MRKSFENSLIKLEEKKNKKLHELKEWALGITLGSIIGIGIGIMSESVKHEPEKYQEKQQQEDTLKVPPKNLRHETKQSLTETKPETEQPLPKIEQVTKDQYFEKAQILTPIETYDGIIGVEVLEKIVRETFPKSWVKTVKKIYMTSEIETFNKQEYGSQFEGRETYATCIYKEDGSLIVYRPIARKYYMAFAIETLGHELSHSYFYFMEKAESVNLTKRLQSRVNAPDRYRSSYVEKIAHEPQKVSEYWAEICAQYFINASKLNFADFELVNNQILKSDPGFNRAESANRRVSYVMGLGSTIQGVAPTGQ